MKKKIRKLIKSEVLRDMSKLSLGSMVAQLIPFLLSPVIARLYTAEHYGAFAAILSLINIISVIVNGRYELCVVLPKDDRTSKTLVLANWLIGFIVALTVGLILFVFSEKLSTIMNIEFGFFESLMVLVALIAIAFWQPLNYLLIRKKAFTKIAFNKVVQTTTLVIATVILGYMGLGDGLIIGYVIGFFCLAIFTIYQARIFLEDLFGNSKSEILGVLKEYSSYTKFTALPALMNSIAGQLGVYLFLFYFSGEITGYYSFSKQYIFVPMGIVGVSLSQVYFQRISEKFANKLRIAKEIKLLFLSLLGVSLFSIIIIQLFGVQLFVILFGEEWRMAGMFSEILIYYFAIQFIVSPMSNILFAVNEVKLAAIFPIVYLIVMVGMFFLPIMEVEDFLNYYIIAETVPYLVYLFLIFFAVNKYERSLNE